MNTHGRVRKAIGVTVNEETALCTPGLIAALSGSNCMNGLHSCNCSQLYHCLCKTKAKSHHSPQLKKKALISPYKALRMRYARLQARPARLPLPQDASSPTAPHTLFSSLSRSRSLRLHGGTGAHSSPGTLHQPTSSPAPPAPGSEGSLSSADKNLD